MCSSDLGGDFSFQPRAARDPGEIGVCDLVLIGLKTTANATFPSLIPPLVGASTAVLTLQNGLGNEESLARFLPADQILGGLCFVCLNRSRPGVIEHLAHGRVVLGEYRRPDTSRAEFLAGQFREAGVPCVATPDLRRAHWEKLVWNIPFNGLGVAGVAGLDAVRRGAWDGNTPLGGCLTTDRLLAEPGWEELVRELMREVITTANGLRLGVDPGLEEQHLASTRSMGPYRASTLVDFERGCPLELEALFLEPLRCASAAGVATPRLESLCRVLTLLDGARGALPRG